MTHSSHPDSGEAALHASIETTRTGAAASPSRAPDACFSKRFTKEWLFRATLRNSLRAWAAAQRSAWFLVPQVLRADDRRLQIDYEFLAGWDPLRTVIRHRTFAGFAPAELHSTFWTIGAALQDLHRHAHRIHGDFDLDNILVKRAADKVAFVDFTPPEYASFRRYNQASRYRDIATFVLFVRAKYPPQWLHLAFRPQLRELVRAFMEGYFRGASAQYDQRLLDGSMNDMLENTYLGETFSGRYLRRSRLYRTDDIAPQR